MSNVLVNTIVRTNSNTKENYNVLFSLAPAELQTLQNIRFESKGQILILG